MNCRRRAPGQAPSIRTGQTAKQRTHQAPSAPGAPSPPYAFVNQMHSTSHSTTLSQRSPPGPHGGEEGVRPRLYRSELPRCAGGDAPHRIPQGEAMPTAPGRCPEPAPGRGGLCLARVSARRDRQPYEDVFCKEASPGLPLVFVPGTSKFQMGLSH